MKTCQSEECFLFDETRNGTRIVIQKLMFHVALYVNYSENSIEIDYNDRYCIKDFPTALKAAYEFFETGKMRYWQKWHNKDITICKGYAYMSGILQTPKNALYAVDWTESAC
jgi:hypothetical protein